MLLSLILISSLSFTVIPSHSNQCDFLDRDAIRTMTPARLAVDFLYMRAQFCGSVSDYDAAIADLNTAIDLAPDSPGLYLRRGQMYLGLYEWDQSLQDYNRAIELAPAYADAYFNRGVLYYSILQTGQALREDALADFRQYLELAPDGEHTGQAAEYVAKIEAELTVAGE